MPPTVRPRPKECIRGSPRYRGTSIRCKNLTRRGLFGAARPAQPPPRSRSASGRAAARRRVDVVVIGAGFAGLTAARARAGRHTRAGARGARPVGGRALNLELPGGEVTERGATFAGPTQDHILALAREVGVATFPTYDTGDNVYLNQGVRLTYPSNGPTGTARPTR